MERRVEEDNEGKEGEGQGEGQEGEEGKGQRGKAEIAAVLAAQASVKMDGEPHGGIQGARVRNTIRRRRCLSLRFVCGRFSCGLSGL